MTEKRLIQYKVLCDDYEEVRRILFEIIETGEEIEGYHQIQEWVDNLYKENEQLKHDATVLIQSNQDYRKENEQLKQQVSERGTQLDFLKDENKHMRDLVNENEQLKKKCEYMEDVLNNQGYEVVFNGERWVIE